MRSYDASSGVSDGIGCHAEFREQSRRVATCTEMLPTDDGSVVAVDDALAARGDRLEQPRLAELGGPEHLEQDKKREED